MKLAGAIGTAILSLTLGASSFGIRPGATRTSRRNRKTNLPRRKAATGKTGKARGEKRAGRKEHQARREERKARSNALRKLSQKNRNSAPAAGRIPDDRYKANFGQGHTFRVSQGDYRNHRFQYGGYWFGFVGAWPSNWLYTQNVYVIDIDGVYYLCNPMYPGVNIELNVVL